jgi:hypothetical protein
LRIRVLKEKVVWCGVVGYESNREREREREESEIGLELELETVG